MLVCLLGTYRSNGPYGEFLQRWLNFATWFVPFLQGLHVITMEPKRFQGGEWHYQLEETARNAACPFALLFDERGDAHVPLAPDRSPLIFALDRRGTIHYEGELEFGGSLGHPVDAARPYLNRRLQTQTAATVYGLRSTNYEPRPLHQLGASAAAGA